MGAKKKHESLDDEKQYKTLMEFGAQQLHENVASTIETAIGRTLPQMEVRFHNLMIAADVVVVQADHTKPELPTLANTVKKAFTMCSLKKHVERKNILNQISGVFKPGTITLVLGQPGSGKSSLMKILSGRFPLDKNVVVEGNITFNGKPQKDFKDRLPQFVSYVNQRDKHFPTLSVRETLDYAHRFCGDRLTQREENFFKNGSNEEKNAALTMARAFTRHYPDIVVQQMGLNVCEHTIVGNAMVRGISGGQRKRVTTAEMLFGKKNVMIMDEISTGLDSAATYDIVNTQRSVARRFRKTTIISLLQPSPEVFALFDNVLILNEGEVMYHGPREHIVEYFQNLGFVCPPRRDIADFLLDLGTNQQAQYQVNNGGDKHPRTSCEFAKVFKESDVYQDTLNSLAEPINPVYLNDMKDFLNARATFQQSFWDNTWTLMHRQLLVTRRNTAFLKGRTIMVVIMGLLYGSTFYQFDPTKVQVVMGMIFSAILFLSLGQASQIPTYVESREVFYKQRGANFLRTSAYVISCSVSQLPIAVGETLLFGSVVYWMCGFLISGAAYGIFELMLFLTNMTFAAWFFFLAAIAPDLHIAKPVSMVSILFFVLFAGFVISKDQLPDYVVWIYWINPIAWCLRSLAVNQYRADDFDQCVYDKIDYCAKFNLKAGKYYLSLFDVPSEKEWIYYGIIFMIVSYFAFMFLSFLVLEYKRYETLATHTSVTKVDCEEQAQEIVRRSTKIAISSIEEDADGVSVVAGGKPTKAKHQVEPVTLAFQDLWYSVPDPKNPKESIDLLKSVTGYAAPGTMTALMGSSGAGKTTLMDVIAGRKTGGEIKGKILLNGHPATDLAIRRSTGYCEQMDIHSETATIREALTFSAFMRQPSDVPASRKFDTVNECLDLLDMNGIADNMIHGSSTEQMKRLTIGVELAAQPSVLFLDEPTSGLDARSAKVIMDGARKVANTGRTIICTIHQPSSEVFLLFDRLLLLKRGGETVFNGNLGPNCANLIAYFEAIPGIQKLPAGYNPATWMLECIGAGVTTGIGGQQETDFVGAFKQSETKKTLDTEMDRDGVLAPAAGVGALSYDHKFAANAQTQMVFLLKRFTQMYWRTPSYNLTRIVISVILSVLFGIIYLKGQYTTYQEINGGVGMIFLTTLFNGVISFNSVLPIASEERASFYREKASQMYHPFWYFLGSTVAEIPYVLASTLVFTVIFYPFVGFVGFEDGVVYWLTTAVVVLLMTYMGQLLAYAMPSVEVAAIMGVLLNSVYFLFMGFNPPAGNIPRGYKWLYYITPQRYALDNLIALAFGKCDKPGDIGCQTMLNAPVTMNANMTIKEYVKDVFDADRDDIPRNFGIMIAFIVFFRFLALLCLRYVNHTKR
ncbi:hypothetical protein Gpo141_00010950 [Globisporangium polare]